MFRKYRELFAAVCDAALSTADTAIQFNQKENKQKDLSTAIEMKESFSKLKDKLQDTNAPLTKEDCLNLQIMVGITMNLIQNKINRDTQVLESYEKDILPKLRECAKNPDRQDSIFSEEIFK